MSWREEVKQPPPADLYTFIESLSPGDYHPVALRKAYAGQRYSSLLVFKLMLDRTGRLEKINRFCYRKRTTQS